MALKMSGRPRRGVTRQVAPAVWRYFMDRLASADPAEAGAVDTPAMADGARQALAEIGPLGDPGALDAWVQRWVSPASWRRCQSALRQRRYSQRGVTVLLHKTTARRLKALASREGLTLNEAIGWLLDRAAGSGPEAEAEAGPGAGTPRAGDDA